MVDGPGIRSVVFLNECHLRCKYCHNPEMLLKGIDNMSALELAEKLLKNKEYFGNGGGVTFSGGEPLLQTKFLEDVIKILKKENIHTAIDTSGITNEDYEDVIKLTDLLLVDIKHTCEEGYKNLTGGNFYKALEFKKFLEKTQKPVWIRQVIVPGIHDNVDYLLSLKKYIDNMNVLRVDFLPFSKLCLEKYKELNLVFPLENVPSMDKIACDELYNDFMNIYNNKA